MQYLLYTIFFLCSATAALAQQRLSGRVTDQTTGEALPGATVYLPDLRQGAATNASGEYQISDLPRGRFLVQVRLVGYSPVVQSVNLDGATTLHVALSQSATELGTILVTGVSASTEMRRSPVPTSVVGQEEMQQRGAANLIDAISHAPGVSQITTGAAIAKPVIRGLSANRVVTLNNGMRQEGQQWGEEHGVEIDEYAVDRAEIIKGPGSIMYGSDAMAGVINFIAADPVEAGRVVGAYAGNYQTNNHLVGNSFMNAGNLNGFNWQARLSQKIAGNYRNDYDGRVYNSGFREYNANGYVGLNKSWGFSHLSFSSFNQNLGLIEGERDPSGRFLKVEDVAGHQEEVPVTDEDLQGYGIHVPRQGVNHLRLASQNNLILGASRLTFNVDWQRNLRQEFGLPHEEGMPDPGHGGHGGHSAEAEEAHLVFDLQTLGYDLKYFLPETGSWKTTFGSSGMQQRNVNRGEEFLIPDYRLFDFGVFGFTQKSYDRLHLSGGLRFDRRHLRAEALFLTDEGEGTTDPAEAAETKFTAFTRNFSNVSGSAGATYEFSKQLTGKLNMARGFRAPNLAELASNGRHEGTVRYELGNQNLNPETSLQLDAGLVLNTEHITLEANGFQNNVQQYIFAEKLRSVTGGDSISDANDPAPTFKYVQGNARLQGGEFSIDLHPHPLDWLHFENTLSFVRGRQLNQPDSTRNLPFIPAPRLQSEVRVNFKQKTGVIRNWFARFEVDHNFAQNRAYTAYGTETPTPAYTLINLGTGLDVRNGAAGNLFSLYLTANNLFDVAYQQHLSRLKYTAVNEATGRQGVFNMGRNISVRLVVPLAFRK